MERNWAGTTYGNTWMHTWLIRILRFIPIRALYAFVFLFVVPVCLVVNPANRIIYRYFRNKEKELYALSDWIGCMSQANVDYVLKQNPEIDPGRVEVCPNSIEVSTRVFLQSLT